MLAILGVVFAPGHAQKLRGITTEQNSDNRPLPNVQVTASLWANPTVSNSDGEFDMKFTDKNPGDEVSIKVKKKGV